MLATTPTVSSAADTQYYAGIECHPERGNQVTQFLWRENRLDDNGNTTAIVRCPVIKDEEGATDGANSLVRVRVQTVGQTVSCRAFSFDKFGTTTNMDTSTFTAPASPANGEIEIQGVNISTADGYYVIRCPLLPKAGICSYYGVEEN